MALAVATGLVIQCGTPAVQNILDAGLDGSLFDGGIFDTGIRDAEADIDIPEGCNCGEPLHALDDRLEDVEARLTEATERLTTLEGGPTPEPDSFSMLISFGDEEPHALLVPGSNVSVGYSFYSIDAEGAFVRVLVISIMAYDPVSRSQITASFFLPGDTEAGGRFSLGSSIRGYSFNASDVSGEEAGRACVVIPTIDGMGATGTVTISRLDERATGTFSGTFTNETTWGACSVSITEGRFDAAILQYVNPGEYVAP